MTTRESQKSGSPPAAAAVSEESRVRQWRIRSTAEAASALHQSSPPSSISACTSARRRRSGRHSSLGQTPEISWSRGSTPSEHQNGSRPFCLGLTALPSTCTAGFPAGGVEGRAAQSFCIAGSRKTELWSSREAAWGSLSCLRANEGWAVTAVAARCGPPAAGSLRRAVKYFHLWADTCISYEHTRTHEWH